MAGRILQEDIEALKSRADLAEVVSDHTRLRRAGARLKGLCPFHQERTPSFTVDAAQGVYHCFGCQAGGDVYTFLQQVERLSFVEAVEQLARRVGYQLRYEELSAGQKRALGERSRLVAVTSAAADWFREQLHGPDGAGARDYLAGRGFGRDELDHFRVGFAPLEWDGLTRNLVGRRFSERDLEDAGLAVRNRRGGLRDRFRGRVVFPILDLAGDVIAFGGRVLPGLDYGGHDPPKYLNSPETAIYRKHEVLYALNWARPEISRAGEVLVGEGYTDVIALHQAGFTNAVATCGTAVGADHLRLLQRYADRVVLAFDSDTAGERAAERAADLARDLDVELRVLVLPSGSDPADVVRGEGMAAMRALVADAEPVARFLLRRAVAPHDDSPEGRAAAVEAAAVLLAELDDPVLRDQYSRLVANDLVGIGLTVVTEAIARADARRGSRGELTPPPATSAGDRRTLSARARLEREVLKVAVQRPDLLPAMFAEVTADDLAHPKARDVHRALTAAGGPAASLDAVLAAAADDEVRTTLRALALEDFTVEPDEAHVEMLVARLLLHRVERDIAARKGEIERINPVADPDGHRARFEALIELEARRRDLRELAAG